MYNINEIKPSQVEINLGVQHHFSDDVYAKEMHLPAGHTAVSHRHKYSHLSIVARGRCVVSVDGVEKEYKAGDCVEIKAFLEHSIHALEYTVWYCIHATKEKNPEKIDEAAIKKLPINKIHNIDFSDLLPRLQKELLYAEYGKHTHRISGDSPHRESTDLWVRFNNPDKVLPETLLLPHDSEWLCVIPSVVAVVSRLYSYLGGTRLGGVLVTRLEPGKQIYPHVDNGWHASYYDKYFIPVINKPGAKFCFDGVEIDPVEGTCYAFRNDVNHWVINESDSVRIALIICVKRDKVSSEGL
jgi:quercetin dioxygenase-like cupin family protein